MMLTVKRLFQRLVNSNSLNYQERTPINDDYSIELNPFGESSTDDLENLKKLPQLYKNIPADRICYRAQKRIVDFLSDCHANSGNPVTSIEKIQKYFHIGNIRHQFKHTYDDIKYILQEWIKKECTIGDLIDKIKDIGRPDILSDEILIKLIVDQCKKLCEDPENYIEVISQMRPIFGPDDEHADEEIEVRYEHPIKWPVQDENPASKTEYLYDVYFSYGEPNKKEALKLADKLEQNKIKLCIPQRDLLATGKSYVEVTCELVMAKCKRTILYITSEFSDSAECKFHAEILFNSSRERFEIPHDLDSLKMVSKVNMQQNDSWEWTKLLRTLQAPLEDICEAYKPTN